MRSDRPCARVPVADAQLSRARNASRSSTSRCRRCPPFTGVDRDALTARIRIAPDDRLSRARIRSLEVRAVLDRNRTSSSPSRRCSIRRLRRNGGAVLSAYVQFAPLRAARGSWDERARAPCSDAIDTIERHAPGLRSLIVAQQVITPLDLERTMGSPAGTSSMASWRSTRC